MNNYLFSSSKFKLLDCKIYVDILTSKPQDLIISDQDQYNNAESLDIWDEFQNEQ